MDRNEYYRMLLQGGGVPIASQESSRGNEILSVLQRLFGQAGDGVASFNPIPSREQVENVINRFIPQDGVKRFGMPEPEVNPINAMSMRYIPKNTLRNREY